MHSAIAPRITTIGFIGFACSKVIDESAMLYQSTD
jgi:hypothetical protein